MNSTIHTRKRHFENAFGNACRLALQKRILLTVILLTTVLIASFSQKASVLLSTYDSCHVQPPQQQQNTFARTAAVASPMLRVAYVIPSNRTPQPNGVANLQHAIKTGQQFFKEQMEQNGFGPKTFVFETETDGVTPLVHVVHVAETDVYLRGSGDGFDLWNRTIPAASNAGISLWAQGEVWVVIPETYLMFPDGSGAGGVALGAGSGSGKGGGVSMIGSNALPLFNPAMITDDTPYDGKVLPELGPYPMKQSVTFNGFEGTTFSSVASSWLGALWHETGHAFGLGHDFRNDTNFHGNLMGNGLRGTRGYLFPEKYPQDYTRLEYWSALFLNVSHYFNSDKTETSAPILTQFNPSPVTPQQGLVHISFQASDPDGLSFAYLIYGGDMAAEILLDGTTADATFAVPNYAQGNINRYTIFVLDKQGNKTATGVEFNVPGGNNQAPIPYIRIDPPVPGLNQPIVLNATQSFDVDHNLSSLMASWDVDNDGQFDTEPSTNKTVQYLYKHGGNYLIRLKVTDPAGAQTISTPVSIKIPGEVNIICQADVTLTSQAEVDAFNCTEVTGNLTISGNDITNLNALSSLRKVGGSLSISDNPNLETIDLPDISVGGLSISNNANLKSIGGFKNTELAGSISIGGNSKLGSISGFNSLRQLADFGGGFSIVQNDALTSLPAFGALVTTPNLRIINNPALLALDGFPALTQVIGDFQISNNESLKTINGFNKLMSISGVPRIVLNTALLIENNASLETLKGLSSLKSISAPLDAGHVPPVPGTVTVYVTGNPMLTQCCSLQPLLDALVSAGPPSQFVRIDISGNGGGCTQEDILNCEQICNGDVTLTSQAEVDAFSCTEVTGNITISGNDITNLNALSSLRKVLGDLTISNNPNLETIDLPALDTLRGGLSIENNSALLTVTGFSSLLYAGTIQITNNPKLASISGFNSLQWISLLGQNSQPYGGFEIGLNDALTNIQGFDALRSTGNFRIGNNRSLLALDGFPALEAVTGTFQVSNNESLRTINGFNKFRSIGGIPRLITTVSLLIQNNASLESLDGLSSLKFISGPVQAYPPSAGTVIVSITGNPQLTQCCSLQPLLNELLFNYSGLPRTLTINISENGGGCTQEDILNCEQICNGDVTLTSQAEVDAFSCTEVTGNLTISGNDITNLNALSSLRKVGGNLSISDNPNLETLDLQALDIDAGSLSISDNANLKSISGFNNTQLASSISIGGNPKLVSISGFNSLRQVLADFGNGFVIGQNDALTILPAFGALITAQNLRIVNNAKLSALDGFPSLTQVIGEFQISNNASLKTINGFNKLTSISGVERIVLNSALLIQNNASLETLDGLSSLKSISAPLDDSRVPPVPGTVTVHVTGNPKLTQCCSLQPLLDALVSAGPPSQFVRIDISGNGGGCALQDILACGSLSILGYDIVDTSGKVVRHLNEGDILYLDDLKCKGQTIVANTTGQIGSVKFDLNNKFFMMQNAFPYTLTGDNYGTYFKPWIPLVGAYTLTATPYSKSDAGGDAGQPLTIHFTVQPGTAVISYDIVNTSGQVVCHLNEGDILYLDDLKSKGQTIVANTTGQIGSVKFDLNNKFFMMQNAFPYTLTGDNLGTYFKPWIPHPGAYTLTATPYSKPDAVGCAGQPLTIHFTVKPKSSAVVSYDIVNTSGQFVRRLNEGDILYLDDLKGKGQTIVANTKGQIGSVKFDVNNAFFMMQNAFPYTLTGDNYGTYFKPWIPQAGSYTITATPYSKSDAGGSVGQSLTIHLTVKPELARAVVSYDIVNTAGKVLRCLNEGDILYLDDLKGKGQTIVANTKGQIGSVKFVLNNAFFMMQNAFPYTLTGDNYGTYFKPWIPKAGSYTLTATPYSKSDAGGDAGRPLTIHFAVTDNNNAASRMIATGIEEDTPVDDGASDVTIYPVPVENELFVKMDDTVGKDAMLYILTLQGVNVYNGTYSQSSSISTVDLKPGVYFLQVVSRNGFRQHVKFIKK